MAITARALDSLMVALGVVDAPVLGAGEKPAAPTRLLSLSRHSQGLYATRRGWFEPAVRLGDSVSAGQLAGWYHDLEQLDVAEQALHFAEGGIVLSRRLHTMCEAGDCLMQVAEPVAG
jgi:predicted deacylase